MGEVDILEPYQWDSTGSKNAQFKGQLGVPLTVYPWYLHGLYRDSWG